MSQLNGQKLTTESKYTFGQIALFIIQRINLTNKFKYDETALYKMLEDDRTKHKITVHWKVANKIVNVLIKKGYLKREFYDPNRPDELPEPRSYVAQRVFLPNGYHTCFIRIREIKSARLLPTCKQIVQQWRDSVSKSLGRQHSERSPTGRRRAGTLVDRAKAGARA